MGELPAVRLESEEQTFEMCEMDFACPAMITTDV